MTISTAEARCGLEFMNAQAEKIDPIAIAVKLTNKGLPSVNSLMKCAKDFVSSREASRI